MSWARSEPASTLVKSPLSPMDSQSVPSVAATTLSMAWTLDMPGTSNRICSPVSPVGAPAASTATVNRASRRPKPLPL